MKKYYDIKKVEDLKNKELNFIISPRLMRLKLWQINLLKDYLTSKYSDPWVEVGAVNETLMILGYAGEFDFDSETMSIKWKAHRDTERFIRND